MTEPFLRASLIFPSRAALCHLYSSMETFFARLSVSVGVLWAPGIFLMIILPSGSYSWSSVTSISEVSPLSSVNCAIIVPSTSIAKLRAANASLLETFGTPVAIYPSLFGERCAARELGDLEYDELGRLHRGNTDLDDELAGVDRLRRVVLTVALDIERFAWRRPEQRAVAPDPNQEGADRALDPLPERHVVGLEDDPLGAQQDRPFDVVEEPANVDVPPGRVAGQRARTPDPDTAAGEGTDHVDALRVEQVVLALGDLQLQRDGAADHLIGGSLVHAARVVAARPDAGHVATRWNEVGLARQRVEDLDPRPVEGGVFRVVAGLVDPPLADLLGVQAGRGVQDSYPVAHQFAVSDHRQLDSLDLVGIDHAALVGGHQVGNAEHRDRVDGFEAGESGAVGGVAHVLVRRDPGWHRSAAALKRNLARGGDLFQCAGGPDLLELD